MGATNSTARKSKQATSHPTLLWTSQDINPQSSSPLFYLPLELQLRIYEYLFGQRRIHLFWEPMTARQKRKSKPTQTQLAYYQVCQHPPPTNTNFWETWTCCPRSGGRTRELTKPGCEVSHALLYSCRKAYNQGIDVLYGTNTFQLVGLHLRELPRFISFKNPTMITSLEIYWEQFDDRPFIHRKYPHNDFHCKSTYDHTWELLALMPALRKLGVACQVQGGLDLPLECLEVAYLESLEKLAGKGLERFDFAMPGAYVKTFLEKDIDRPYKFLIMRE